MSIGDKIEHRQRRSGRQGQEAAGSGTGNEELEGAGRGQAKADVKQARNSCKGRRRGRSSAADFRPPPEPSSAPRRGGQSPGRRRQLVAFRHPSPRSLRNRPGSQRRLFSCALGGFRIAPARAARAW